jgi:hypothetical protein
MLMSTSDSNPYDPGSDLPGALGKGQAVASALGNFFKFWAYASTIIGAIMAGPLEILSGAMVRFAEHPQISI